MKALLYSFFCLITFLPASEQQAQSLLNEGLKLESEGKYLEALDLWSGAMTKLDEADFAIGRAYIRVATEQQLRNKYRMASSMYFWGLSAESVSTNLTALQQEVDYLKPILSRDNYSFLKKLINQRKPEIFRYLQGYWEVQDPTPATRNYNERLIEHWQRIAYARANFNKRDNTVYGTDDRGEVYVEFGEPDRMLREKLFLSLGDIEYYCQLIGCGEILPLEVFRLHQQPEVEIWVYDRFNDDMRYNLIQIFGTPPDGNFSLLNSLDDFIPTRAFSIGQRYELAEIGRARGVSPRKNWLTPGMLLQFIYYEKYMAVDYYFTQRYMDMEAYFLSQDDPRKTKSQGQVERDHSLNISIRERSAAPEEESTDEKSLTNIPLHYYTYRFMKEGIPVAAVFIQSDPTEALRFDNELNDNILFTEDDDTAAVRSLYYEMKHGINVDDGNMSRLAHDRVDIPMDFSMGLSQKKLSFFMLPMNPEYSVTAYAELYNYHPESVSFKETAFESAMRGMGQIKLRLDEPLKADTGKMLISDLMLGYDLDEDAEESELFPFTISHEKVIPRQKDLVLYFELYQVLRKGMFNMQISVTPDGGLLGRRDQENQVTLSVDLSARNNIFAETLQIQTRSLQPGKYNMNLQLMHKETGQVIKRKVEFRITD
jgi:GWxTD domain-containing protein